MFLKDEANLDLSEESKIVIIDFIEKYKLDSSTEKIKSDYAPAYIESLIENTAENLKMTTKEIEQQNINQQKNKKTISINKRELKMLSTNFCYGGDEFYEFENSKN